MSLPRAHQKAVLPVRDLGHGEPVYVSADGIYVKAELDQNAGQRCGA
jgi:hypothetical protein